MREVPLFQPQHGVTLVFYRRKPADIPLGTCPSGDHVAWCMTRSSCLMRRVIFMPYWSSRGGDWNFDPSAGADIVYLLTRRLVLPPFPHPALRGWSMSFFRVHANYAPSRLELVCDGYFCRFASAARSGPLAAAPTPDRCLLPAPSTRCIRPSARSQSSAPETLAV